MSDIHVKQKSLVAFDHWSWLLFVVWFAAATAITFMGYELAGTISYWGIVAVLVNNLLRLFLLAGYFKSEKKGTYLWLTLLLILILVLSVLFQLYLRKQL